MSSVTGAGTERHGRTLPWPDILLSAIAAVSWALIGMAGTAALGLHLLRADAAGSLGPMTAAVVALAAGGSVSPSGDVSAFGLTGAQAHTAIEFTPLGVSLVGALLLSWFFLRSLRAAGVVVAPGELLARAGAVLVLFVAMLGGLAWAGHDVITIDGGSLGLDRLPGGGGKGGGLSIPGLGDVSGLLPDRIGHLIHAKAAVGFTVDTSATLLGGLGWCAGILLIALLASRRTPLPPGWSAVHRVVRPAVSALVTALLLAVVAGLAAAGYAAVGDDHPRRIAGAALLGAPNGVWLGIPLGLFVPWDGRATGELGRLLPHPLDQLLGARSDQPVTVGRLADLDGRVWLLVVAAALLMLLAGVLTAARTPVRPTGSALALAGQCALRLGVATALALPLLAWLTNVSVSASLSVLGFDAFGASIALHARLALALLLGALWGAGAGATGALLARATGAAGRRATWVARMGAGAGTGVPQGGERAGGGYPGYGAGTADGAGYGSGAGLSGHGAGGGHAAYGEGAGTAGGAGGGYPGYGTGMSGGTEYGEGVSGPKGGGKAGAGYPGRGRGTPAGHAGHGEGTVGSAEYGGGGERFRAGAGGGERSGYSAGGGHAAYGDGVGPYLPSRPYRPPNPDTNPYLKVPEEGREEPPDAVPPQPGEDVYGAPTIAGPLGPAPPPPRRGPAPRPDDQRRGRPEDGPPPPPGTPKRRG